MHRVNFKDLGYIEKKKAERKEGNCMQKRKSRNLNIFTSAESSHTHGVLLLEFR